MKAILLFAHGARDPAWASPIEAIAAEIRARSPGTPVGCAYLEFIAPDLPSAIDHQVAQGATEIVIVPMFMAHSGHTKRDLPGLLAAAQTRHPALRLRLATPIGEAASVVAAIAGYALNA